MLTLKDIFINDPKELTFHYDIKFGDKNGNNVRVVIARVHLAIEACAKYWSFYIDDYDDYLEIIECILNHRLTQTCYGKDNPMPCSFVSKIDDYQGGAVYNYPSDSDLVFTGMIHLYINRLLTDDKKSEIFNFGKKFGYFIIIKDLKLVSQTNATRKPVVFISHDSRDKESFVRELAFKLVEKNCPVWYDEFSLNVGDNLREKIEMGLKETKYCIVVLSKNFISNEGWGKTEFNSVFTREVFTKNKVLLPIWNGVTAEEVYNYSPILLDRMALDTSKDEIGKIAEKIAYVIHNEK